MNEEFLTGLGVGEETAAKIMQQYRNEQFSDEIEQAIKAADATDTAAVRALLDAKAPTTENLSECIKELKSEHPALFKSAPRVVSTASHELPDTAEKFKRMGYAQRLKLFHESPELYKKLV